MTLDLQAGTLYPYILELSWEGLDFSDRFDPIEHIMDLKNFTKNYLGLALRLKKI